MWRIVHSPFGLHLRSLRDNAQKAEYLGVRVRQFRLAAFVISAIYGAIGGAILGFRTGLADPELVYWTHSGHLVFMTVLGRLLELPGPDRRRARADAAAGPAAVLHAILAFRAGRHPRLRRHLRPAGARRLGRRTFGSLVVRRGRQAARDPPLETGACPSTTARFARSKTSRIGRRRRIRLDRRPERRRQDHAGQPADGPAGADQGRGLLQGGTTSRASAPWRSPRAAWRAPSSSCRSSRSSPSPRRSPRPWSRARASSGGCSRPCRRRGDQRARCRDRRASSACERGSRTLSRLLSQGEKKLLDVASAFALEAAGDPARRADLGRRPRPRSTA